MGSETTAGPRDEFVPMLPDSLRELGIRSADIEAIVLKFLLNSGPHIGFEIAKHIRVPLSLITGFSGNSRTRSWWVYKTERRPATSSTS